MSNPAIRLAPSDQPSTLLDACALPGGFHADPADRILVAPARQLGATLVTRDEKILRYGKPGHVQIMAA